MKHVEEQKGLPCLAGENLLEAVRVYLEGFGDLLEAGNATVCDPSVDLIGYLAHADFTFSRRLFQLIRESGISEVEVYKRAHVDRKLFSKIRSDSAYQPKKTTVVAFALALRLPPAQAQALLESAGYSLSRSAHFDLIVRYFLEQGIYDLLKVNDALFEFGQPLLTV